MENENKTIGEILKHHGLDVAEEVAMKAVSAVLRAVPDIAQATGNKYLIMVAPFASMIERPLLEIIDELDGECDLCKE